MFDSSGSNGSGKSDYLRQFEARMAEDDYLDPLDVVDFIRIKWRIWDRSGASDDLEMPRLSPERNFTRSYMPTGDISPGLKMMLPWLLPVALLLVVIVIAIFPWASGH